MTMVRVRCGQTSLLSTGKAAKGVGVMIQWIAASVLMKLYEAPTYLTKRMKMIKIRTSTPLMTQKQTLLQAVDKYIAISQFNRKMKKMMMTMTLKRMTTMVDHQVRQALAEPIKQHLSINVVESLMLSRKWNVHTGTIHDPIDLASSSFAGMIKIMSLGSWSAPIFSSHFQRCYQYTSSKDT